MLFYQRSFRDSPQDVAPPELTPVSEPPAVPASPQSPLRIAPHLRRIVLKQNCEFLTNKSVLHADFRRFVWGFARLTDPSQRGGRDLERIFSRGEVEGAAWAEASKEQQRSRDTGVDGEGVVLARLPVVAMANRQRLLAEHASQRLGLLTANNGGPSSRPGVQLATYYAFKTLVHSRDNASFPQWYRRHYWSRTSPRLRVWLLHTMYSQKTAQAERIWLMVQ
jgi:hypothetical protein